MLQHLSFGFKIIPANLPTWLSLDPIYGNLPNEGIAYKIVVTNPNVNVEIGCRKNKDGTWEIQNIGK